LAFGAVVLLLFFMCLLAFRDFSQWFFGTSFVSLFVCSVVVFLVWFHCHHSSRRQL
jgi:hypothetical protein